MSVDPQARRKRLTDRLKAMHERVQLLEQELEEFTGGFFRVCIFGSARIQPDDEIYRTTERLAFLLGEEGIDVLTGGGPGLMEAANKGLLDGREASGSKSKSFGISIELNQFEPANDHIDIKHHHKRFSSRLDDFMRLSNAVIVMPGGIGTALELFFSWQLLQVAHLRERPIILVGEKFWQGLIDWVKEVQIAQGLVSEKDLRFIQIVDTPEQALDLVLNKYETFLEKRADLKEAELESDV